MHAHPAADFWVGFFAAAAGADVGTEGFRFECIADGFFVHPDAGGCEAVQRFLGEDVCGFGGLHARFTATGPI